MVLQRYVCLYDFCLSVCARIKEEATSFICMYIGMWQHLRTETETETVI